MVLTTRRLATIILFVALFALAVSTAITSESFWQLQSGKWMLDNGRPLNFDVFSHTYLNAPWLNSSWLSELFMAFVYRGFGFIGLKLAAAAIVWLSFLFVYISGRGDSYLRVYVVMAAAITSVVYWPAQSQVVSMLLTAVFGFILITYRKRGANGLWLLPIGMMLWVNMDGGFVAGFAILLATIVGESLNWMFNRSDIQARNQIVWLVITSLLCVVAVIVNPNGIQIFSDLFHLPSIDLLQNLNQSWQSPNFHERIVQLFIVFWLVTLGAVGFSGKRLDPVDFLLFATFTAFALIARQNIPLFTIVATPILITHGSAVVSALQTRWPRLMPAESPRSPAYPLQLLNGLILALVLATCLLKTLYFLSPKTIEESIVASQPAGAMAYLKDHPVQGRLFNSYSYGGYLIWALYPDTQVFVDSRTGLYSAEFLQEAFSVSSSGTNWRELFERYNIMAVLVDVKAPLARALLTEAAWAEQYRDHNSVIIINTDD